MAATLLFLQMAAPISAKFTMPNFSFFCVCLIFSLCLVYSNKASEIPRPRGVSISKASFYIPDKDFTCFDGSNKIPFSQVNDDYCDCSDGSDEPGTSACPNSFFHCTNAGFRPMNIPSSQVNDGICDCCDGGDEYAGLRHCENTCLELGKAERQEAQKRAEIAKTGNEARIEASKKGKLLKEGKREKLEQLEKDNEEAEKIRTEREAAKKEAEDLEKSAMEMYRKLQEEHDQVQREEENLANEAEALNIFELLDSNDDKKIEVSELTARNTFDQNKDGAVTEEEAKFFLDNNDELDFEGFTEKAWPRMKPFFMLEKGLFKPPSEVQDEEADEENEDKGIGTVEDVTGEYHEERQEQDEDTREEPDLDAEELEDEEEEEEEEESDGEPPQPPADAGPIQYDENTQNLINAAQSARSAFDESDRNVRDIQREMSQLKEYLEKDFGPEEEFAPLEGECFEYTDREYVYKLCPFDQASQRPKSGGSETRLGVWSKWAGPIDNKYSAMLYDKGQSCWNGPQRSAFVAVTCGIENALVAVSEPNKCEYRFEFNTPSACRVSDAEQDHSHDEL